MIDSFWKLTCRCGEQMEYMVGNRGVEAYYCLKCGRGALKSDGKASFWLEHENLKGELK
jgi:hypothetical protein